jgi:hypothetical protein
MYVLNVDLWSEDALREVNLVRHTTATPSISSTTPASYASIEQSTPAFSNVLPSSRDTGYGQQMGYQPPGPSVNPYAMQQQYSGMPSASFMVMRSSANPAARLCATERRRLWRPKPILSSRVPSRDSGHPPTRIAEHRIPPPASL